MNARQKENFNFQKAAAALADYGFNSIRVTDDWKGADFIAAHKNGITFLKIQLKGRLTFDRKYIGNKIYVCFPNGSDWFLCPHDALLRKLSKTMNFTRTRSWKEKGSYSFNNLSQETERLMSKYKL